VRVESNQTEAVLQASAGLSGVPTPGVGGNFFHHEPREPIREIFGILNRFASCIHPERCYPAWLLRDDAVDKVGGVTGLVRWLLRG
jgi:hypothetical protein